jgi:hypothetical protein
VHLKQTPAAESAVGREYFRLVDPAA